MLYTDSQLTVHGSELGPSQRDSVWAPGVPYAPAGSLSTLPWPPHPSLFSLLDLSPCPSRRTWEEMTVLCLVPEPCPRVVDAQRNTTNYEWASEWLPSWPGCLPSILPLETMELSTISTVLFFPCHVIGIILYVAFSEGLFSLSNMHLKLLHVFSWLNSSLIFSADLYSIVWVYHSLFIHSVLKDILVVFKFQQLWIKLL